MNKNIELIAIKTGVMDQYTCQIHDDLVLSVEDIENYTKHIVAIAIYIADYVNVDCNSPAWLMMRNLGLTNEEYNNIINKYTDNLNDFVECV